MTSHAEQDARLALHRYARRCHRVCDERRSLVKSAAMRLLFCGSGWLPIVDRIRARLPAGSTIATWDRRAPLAEVVGDADVLLPSNAAITATVIAAAPRLRLIMQPAAGTE